MNRDQPGKEESLSKKSRPRKELSIQRFLLYVFGLIFLLSFVNSWVTDFEFSSSDGDAGAEEETYSPPKVSRQEPIRKNVEVINDVLVPTVDYETLIQHGILEEKVDDLPIKTNFQRVLLIGEPTVNRQQVKDVLHYHYADIAEKTGFKYHKHPTNIYVYAYMTLKKAENGMEQWIGMIGKGQNDAVPDLRLSDTQFKSLNEVKSQKWGLEHHQRQLLWKQLIHVETRAQDEADGKYSIDKPGLTKEELIKNARYTEALTEKYKKELAQQFGVKRSIVDSIAMEGFVQGWAFPKQGF